MTHLKSEVVKVPLKIVAKDEEDQSRATQRALEEANVWFSEEGGLGGVGVRRAVFEAQMLDDILVVGAAALHFGYATVGARADRKPTEIRAFDSSTIQPLVTPYGFPIGDESPAFSQWVQGIQIGQFTRDEMIYEGLPAYAVTHTPYFGSPTEQAAVQIYTLVRVDQWNRVWLTEGSGHKRWLKLNESVTPSQALEWLEMMKLQTQGNDQERHGMGIAPGEMTGEESRKDQDFEAYEHSRIDRVCLSYGVNPASIGQHSRQYKDSQEAAMDSTREGMVADLLLWREDLYNRILRRMGWEMLAVTEDVPPPNESAQERTTRQAAEIGGGGRTINQIRAENGDDPVDGGDELLFPASLKPLSQIMAPATRTGVARRRWRARRSARRRAR